MRRQAQVRPDRVLDHSICADEIGDPGRVESEGADGRVGPGHLAPGGDEQADANKTTMYYNWTQVTVVPQSGAGADVFAGFGSNARLSTRARGRRAGGRAGRDVPGIGCAFQPSPS